MKHLVHMPSKFDIHYPLILNLGSVVVLLSNDVEKKEAGVYIVVIGALISHLAVYLSPHN